MILKSQDHEKWYHNISSEGDMEKTIARDKVVVNE